MTMTTTKFTLRDYMALPESYPAELIHGELVKSPSPTWPHQQIVGRVYRYLTDSCGAERVFLSPIDCFVDDENVLQPDVCVLRAPLLPTAPDIGIPLLVFEVLSPSTARRDRRVKTEIYLGAGVAEVFLLDREAKTIERVAANGRTLHGVGDPVASTAEPGLLLDSAALLAVP